MFNFSHKANSIIVNDALLLGEKIHHSVTSMALPLEEEGT